MFETNLESHEIVESISFPVRTKCSYIKFVSQASKYAIVGVFGSILNNKVSIAITGASNKVFSLDSFLSLSPKELKVFDFNNLDLNELHINSDIHASSSYRLSLIKTMLSNLISSLL